MTFSVFGYAFLGGLLPSIIWLYFLLKEDAAHPEPKAMIALAFVAGMTAVPLAIPLEEWAHAALHTTFSIIVSWALIEEVLKYAMAAVFILWRPIVDEAPDYVIYMITVALGFAAAENMLYLVGPIASGHLFSSLLTDDTRFIGSTLLHVFASASIGFALAFSDRSRPSVRVMAAAIGLILAVALHTTFNALIMSAGASATLMAMFLVWIAAVIFFAVFEVLKYLQPNNLITNRPL